MNLYYDIIVIGGGHAGCEAAAAAARLGSRTLLLTMDMTKMANMSCNPAVGGVAKGQIVREIDALGGEMGRITDLTAIQFRMLNKSKGAAMWSPRAQCDKTRFSELWRKTLENIPNLYIWQDAAVDLIFENTSSEVKQGVDNQEYSVNSGDSQLSENPLKSSSSDCCSEKSTPAPLKTRVGQIARVVGVKTRMGVTFSCRSVILTAGTFLEGVMHCGSANAEGGRAGDAASHGITSSLMKIGFESGRMKTGTPARLDARTIDFTHLEPQYGDENPAKFSFSKETSPVENQMPCYLVYTSKEVHDTLRTGFDRSPLFNGTIHGIGPRYCPSIEDKLRTFADKEQHQLFLEPEGRSTNEYYLNGFSSSLPWEVQWEAIHQIKGLENLHIYRPGYAIEYDYFPPTQLHHTLETRLVTGLYFAGQVNGTTGYEEAAAQGLMAAINAHRQLKGLSEVVLKRDEAYIGVLIDDLITKGVDEPYRMFTSRAEYRILLRQDNADARLTPLGHEIGLISDERFADFQQKNSAVESLVSFLRNESVRAEQVHDYLLSVGTDPLTQGRKAYELLMRNQVTLSTLKEALPRLKRFIEKNSLSNEVLEEAEIQIKYKGYIEREKLIAEKLHRLENILIPEDFNYHEMNALTIEARQKLTKHRPTTIGQASRISGVSPADVNVLLIKFGR